MEQEVISCSDYASFVLCDVCFSRITETFFGVLMRYWVVSTKLGVLQLFFPLCTGNTTEDVQAMLMPFSRACGVKSEYEDYIDLLMTLKMKECLKLSNFVGFLK